ncbi:MAG: Crp/Fnr family transcriptional regulator [Dehalococcoidia bacterium]|jgi:CRP-like cAMP-binding protein|nr:Crp/Fnr family transcriptional regulator [Dehalococcoidia bacterium]
MVEVQFLSQVPIFAHLEPERLQLLTDKLRLRRYQRGEVIFHEGDAGDRLHIITKGNVKLSVSSEDGREKTIALFKPGECLGEMDLLDGSARSATATAIDAVETLGLMRGDFLDVLAENPQVAADITKLLTQRLLNVNQMLADAVFLDVPTRVAKQLLTLAGSKAGDAGPAGPRVVPLGHCELASLVGAGRETVSRALNSYRRMGILTTFHRRIVINDSKGLERMATL